MRGSCGAPRSVDVGGAGAEDAGRDDMNAKVKGSPVHETERDRGALAGAFAVQHRASLVGFDWSEPGGALEKVREETDEAGLGEEVGDLLFAVVNLARLLGVDPVAALSAATAKFEERFAEVRRLAEERGLPMPGTPLGPLDRLWDEVKGRRRGSGREEP